ncbi:MAG: sulfotransferase family protein, partial [Woeseiaceae bacterium]
LLPSKNIFIYYALGKELEDLELWDEAFRYYEMAGEAAKSVSAYDVERDLDIIETTINTCDEAWLRSASASAALPDEEPVPIFVVGLPRSGTTLTERIIASHSRVCSIGETYFLQTAIRRESGIDTGESMSPEIIVAAANASAAKIRSDYLAAVGYKLGSEPMFVEKLPENHLYLGFIAKSFPDARIVHVRRNPMDSCFAMFKQSWFRYAYTLEDVGRYYVAYDRLMSHWRSVLGDRLTEVAYESLVAEQEGETRCLLDRLGLPFEDACLRFEQSSAPSATASAVQVREKVHDRSVDRWRRFEDQLSGLREYLEGQGIDIAT